MGTLDTLMLCFILLGTLPSASLAGTANLPSYPLAVRSPYLSTWVPGRQVLADAATAQSEFWAGQRINWPILARVDGKTYSLFGNPHSIDDIAAASTVGVSYTSSHTFLNLTAGAASFTLDFFSPVFPGSDDFLRQSLPYSYLTVTATSSSSGPVDVQILSAIDNTWTAQNGEADLNYTSHGKAGLFWFYNPDQISFTERSDMATYGSVVFATISGDRVTHACAMASSIYAEFTSKGSLTAATSCTGIDLAALSKDLGNVNDAHPGRVTFAVGLDRKEAIDYLNTTQTGYHYSKWPTVPEAVEYFLQDYSHALAKSSAFDMEVRRKTEAVSSVFGEKYADIVEASVRQTFGALELTVPADDLTATPSVFLKEISSDGNINTIDILFQTWPIFISWNPEYIRLFFQPVLSYLNLPKSEGWPKPWVIHDLGYSYPNATGYSDGVAESLPLFETSSLFILLYAYQKYTGDKAWAQQYLRLLENYAEYLAENSLYPASQLTSVDAIAPTANQTALAIQCAVGLQAAGIITGNDTYAALAASYARIIYDDALGLDGDTVLESTHFTYNYGNGSTWNVIFAAFSDIILDLNTFPAAAWELQSSWYLAQMEEAGLAFAGPASDTTYTGKPFTWGLVDWNIVAAAASSTTVQEAVINTTHAFLTNGLNDAPFGTKYEVQGPDAGKWIANKARSTVGSNFALVALQQGLWNLSRENTLDI